MSEKWSQIKGAPEFTIEQFYRGFIAAHKLTVPKGWSSSWTEANLEEYYSKHPAEKKLGDWNTFCSKIREYAPQVSNDEIAEWGIEPPWSTPDYYKKRAAMCNRRQRDRKDGKKATILFIPPYPSKNPTKRPAIDVMDELLASIK